MLFKNPRLIKLFIRYIKSYNKSKRTLKIVLESVIKQINNSPTLKNKLTLNKSNKTTDEIYIKYRLSFTPNFNAYIKKIDKSTYFLNINYWILFKIYDILNVLFYEKNSSFYKIVSGNEKEYNYKKADWLFDILYEYALKVVISHELGHIVNWHIDYCLDNLWEKRFRYYLNDELNKTIADRLFLEMDADNFSSATITSQLIFNENIEYYNQELNLIKDMDHAKLLLIVASSIIYASINYYCHNNKWIIENDISKLNYLPWRLRYYSYYNYLLCYFSALHKNTFFLKPESYNEEILNLEYYTYIYFRDVLWNNVYFNKIATPISDDDINKVTELEKEWNKYFKKKLQKYTFLPIF